MGYISDYRDGTVSLTTGTRALVGDGTAWTAIGLQTGDMFLRNGFVALIETVIDDTHITLRDDWGGPTLPAGSSYSIKFSPDQSRVQASVVDLIRRLSNGNIDALSALTLEVDRLIYADGPNSLALTTLTAYARGLLAAEDAAAMMTALGASAIGQALSTAANPGAAQDAIGATAVGKAVLTAGDQAAGRTAIGAAGADAVSASFAGVDAELGSVNAALAKRLRFDTAQTLTAAEQGQARENSGAGVLAGFRNKIINGNFDVWQRGASQTGNGYGSDDRWYNSHVGSTKTHSRVAFPIGQTDVPGNHEYFSRTIVNSVPGASNQVIKLQRIEGVRTLAGELATITFWARSDAARNIAVEIAQGFGTGGAPSPLVSLPCGLVDLSTSWKRTSILVDVPSIAGKSLGTNGDDSLQLVFWFDAGSSFNARTSNLGQQSGTFDLARVSIVAGDATAEADPFEPRHVSQEEMLCLRYYFRSDLAWPSAPSQGLTVPFPVPMRASPSKSVTLYPPSANVAGIGGDRFGLNVFGITEASSYTELVVADAEL